MIHYEIKQCDPGFDWILYEIGEGNNWATRRVAIFYEHLDAKCVEELLNVHAGHKLDEQNVVPAGHGKPKADAERMTKAFEAALGGETARVLEHLYGLPSERMDEIADACLCLLRHAQEAWAFKEREASQSLFEQEARAEAWEREEKDG